MGISDSTNTKIKRLVHPSSTKQCNVKAIVVSHCWFSSRAIVCSITSELWLAQNLVLLAWRSWAGSSDFRLDSRHLLYTRSSFTSRFNSRSVSRERWLARGGCLSLSLTDVLKMAGALDHYWGTVISVEEFSPIVGSYLRLHKEHTWERLAPPTFTSTRLTGTEN